MLADASSSLGGGITPDPDGTRHLHPRLSDGDATFRLDLGNGQHIQVIDDGTAHPSARVAIIPLGIEGFDRIEAVQRLLSALHGRAIPPDTRLTRQQRDRHRRMLRAFDGTRAGATQQEIAEVLFDIGRLTRDQWQASADRHRVKTLLRDARAMIAGGYRKLLRHRRKA